jgi:hypothetical protein
LDVDFGLDLGGGGALGWVPRPERCPKGSLGLLATVSSSGGWRRPPRRRGLLARWFALSGGLTA